MNPITNEKVKQSLWFAGLWLGSILVFSIIVYGVRMFWGLFF